LSASVFLKKTELRTSLQIDLLLKLTHFLIFASIPDMLSPDPINFKKIDFKKVSVPGISVTGITGAVIGSFMGSWLAMLGMALLGALIGNIVWAMGGQRFSLFIVIGIFLGAGLAILLGDMDAALLGAGTGGAIGGFVAVNMSMLKPGAF